MTIYLYLLLFLYLKICAGEDVELETDAIMADLSHPLTDTISFTQDQIIQKPFISKEPILNPNAKVLKPIYVSPEAKLLSFDRDIPYLRKSKRIMQRDAIKKAKYNLHAKIASIHRSSHQDIQLAQQVAKKLIYKTQRRYAQLMMAQELIIKKIINKSVRNIKHVLMELEAIKTLSYRYNEKSSKIPPYLESLADRQKRMTTLNAKSVKREMFRLDHRMMIAQQDLKRSKVLVHDFLRKARKGFDVSNQLIQNDYKKRKSLTKVHYLARMQKILDQETLALNLAESNYIKMNHQILFEYKKLLEASKLHLYTFAKKSSLDQKQLMQHIMLSFRKNRHILHDVTRRRIAKAVKGHSLAVNHVSILEARKVKSIRNRNYDILLHIQRELKRQMRFKMKALKAKLAAISNFKAARLKVTMAVRSINKEHHLRKLGLFEELDSLKRESAKAALKFKVSMREAYKGNIYN